MKKCLAFILIIFSFSSCILFNNADHPLVGQYHLIKAEHETSRDYVLRFMNEGKFSIVRHTLTVQEEGEKKSYFHYYHTYKGTFETNENILTLHYTDTIYKMSFYLHLKDVPDPIDSIVRSDKDFLPYDEIIKYEFSGGSKDLIELVRRYNTDSSDTQLFERDKFL